MQTRTIVFLILISTLIIVLWVARYFPEIHFLLLIVVPLFVLGIYDVSQKKHTLLRLYPVIGHIRYLFESLRPEIQQYFVESDTNGMPVSREFRSMIYQRAKGVRDTRPFGTIFDVYRDGYEWVNHSMAPTDADKVDSSVIFGGSECTQPYNASPLNISAMSFGALSKTAIQALNLGAKIGGFAHNTGEGGLSPYHLEGGGDLIWQIGTGYFGCRNSDGFFDIDLFKQKSANENVKMIEIKLSQGAKPGHGGILPAIKLTQEIATIRHVPMGQDVISPAAHSAFDSPIGLLEFVQELRVASNGKPVGFKLCIGKKSEFLAICKAMIKTGIKPDFITIDGSEGGTGAAPVELTNSVGYPLKDGLVFARNALIGCGLREEIKIIASGKSFSAFHLLRLLALGADTVNSARGMMFALGCIQSRHCNTDKCPTGIATQDPKRFNAIDIEDKSKRVARYHHAMIENLHELIAAIGLSSTKELTLEHINHRVQGSITKTYAELFPIINSGEFLTEKNNNVPFPADFESDWTVAKAESWR